MKEVNWNDYANRKFILVEGPFILVHMPSPDDDVAEEEKFLFELLLFKEIGSSKYAFRYKMTSFNWES